MKKSMAQNGLILAAFAVVTTGLIGLTFSGTEQSIEAQQQKKLLSILNAIIPTETYDNSIQHDCAIMQSPEWLGSDESQHVYRARKGEQLVATAIETIAPDGYSGKIKLVVGVTGSGTVSGVRVLEHKETPGLGDKIDLRVSDWILSFDNQSYNQDRETRWAVRKDGGQFDQFTGATITPRAVVKAVKHAVIFSQQQWESLDLADNACHPEDSTSAG